MTEPADRLAAALVGRYTIERELGAGGMATVYLAHDLKHDRDVALKVLRADVAQSVGADRFLREIQLAAKLTHPHILSLFDSGSADGALFYVMPNVEGESLRDKLNTSAKLPVADAVRITQEVAGALDYAHRHGVVHRDIKPENIMLQDGHALVADFGIGKAVSAIEGDTFTQTGATVGTPAYMSPEQAAGEAVDGRSDLYSLGCVLYEMLTGEQPFTGPTVQAVIAKRFVQTPADVTALREGVSRPVARALQKALARTPIDRFETGSMLVAALNEVDAAPSKDKGPPPPEKSIAVLPFANMSADPENEFFADGVTEEILNALSQIAELRVAGRTSAFSFKGKNQDLRSIGEQLNVRTVLEGSVRRAGKRVRITAQLIDVTDGYHLWSEKYDREIEDVFAVQDEIASAIAHKMKTTLKVGAEAKAQRVTDNIEAYEAYLKGRALLYQRGAAIRVGLDQMQKALSLDPEYGLAWAGIADTYSLLGYYGMIAPEVAREKAGEAAAKALEFAPDLAETQTAIGLFNLLYEWNWAESKRAFTRALELNPGYIQGAAWYGLFYFGFACGKWDRALEIAKECWSRDTLSAYAASIVGITYATHFNDPAVYEWSDRATALDPGAFLSIWLRQLAAGSTSDWARGVAVAEESMHVHGRQVLQLTNLGLQYFESGNAALARSVYEEMRARAPREHIPPTAIGMLAAALSERDVAVECLNEAIRRRDPQLVIFAQGWLGSNYFRDLPEHKQAMRDIGLTQWIEGMD